MGPITTHVLDTSRGRPASGVPIVLDRVDGTEPRTLGRGVTDGDGRLRDLLPAGTAVEPGTYRLTFDTATYYAAQVVDGFYPSVSITFTIRAAGEHYHVPLLLNPFGYSTYRGS
ncbi:MAG: hydroxyisourate hydrolase [Myxococcales bacterium]|nr:hydroxyisourate hydrolase [Myxococcales bacterium]